MSMPNEPAEPVIEVDPGEPTHHKWKTTRHKSEHPAVPAQPQTLSSPQGDVGVGGSVPQNLPELIGGPVRPRGAKELSHSQDKTHSRNADEALKPTSAPAVPAQEAPRCPTCGGKGLIALNIGPCPACHPTAEPQAGAQVPSREQVCVRTGLVRVMYDASEMDEYLDRLRSHLNSIKSYATEAAKTPITREDMHDPLKAQTFYDEAKGFERLVLSEIGGGQ